MRSTLLLVAVIVALGVFVARHADHAVLKSGTPNGGSATGSASVAKSRAPQQNEYAPAEQESTPNNRLPEIIRMSPSIKSVTLRGDSRGHFKVEARVDGRRLEFLVDTGASAVALRASDAAKLNIHPSERDYVIKMQTANGTGKAALARINVMEIENIIVRDIVAYVHDDKLLNVNLLGMSFLSRVRFTHDRGKLIIEQ